MAIPALTSSGVLPAGIHAGSIEELRTRFGVFQQNDQRPRLFDRLKRLVDAMQCSGLFDHLLIDGSFVTAALHPNDIDIIAVLKGGHDFERDLPISEYALVSRGMVARRFRVDMVVAEQDGEVYNTYVEFFNRVREYPELRKGVVRLNL